MSPGIPLSFALCSACESGVKLTAQTPASGWPRAMELSFVAAPCDTALAAIPSLPLGQRIRAQPSLPRCSSIFHLIRSCSIRYARYALQMHRAWSRDPGGSCSSGGTQHFKHRLVCVSAMLSPHLPQLCVKCVLHQPTGSAKSFALHAAWQCFRQQRCLPAPITSAIALVSGKGLADSAQEGLIPVVPSLPLTACQTRALQIRSGKA